MRDNSIAQMRPFRSGSHFGELIDIDGVNYYAVFSYGLHWPLALTRKGDVWLINTDRYSQPTTNRHSALTQACLSDCVTVQVSKDELVGLISGRNRELLSKLDSPMVKQADLFGEIA